MTLDEVRAKLVGLWYVDANYVRADGVDVVIQRSSEWDFDSISEIADVLNIRNIDLRSIAKELCGPDDARLVRRWNGCNTCGHGDELVVRGALVVSATETT